MYTRNFETSLSMQEEAVRRARRQNEALRNMVRGASADGGAGRQAPRRAEPESAPGPAAASSASTDTGRGAAARDAAALSAADCRPSRRGSFLPFNLESDDLLLLAIIWLLWKENCDIDLLGVLIMIFLAGFGSKAE